MACLLEEFLFALSSKTKVARTVYATSAFSPISAQFAKYYFPCPVAVKLGERDVRLSRRMPLDSIGPQSTYIFSVVKRSVRGLNGNLSQRN